MRRFKYGWKKEKEDKRDFLFTYKKINLPAKVDLRKNCSPIENQETLGSCTANAIVGALEYNDYKDDAIWTDLSRLFIYYNERKLENNINEDAGAYIRDGIKSLVKWGVCSEKIWPYQISKFTTKPSLLSYIDAKKRKIREYQRINGLIAMKSCLAEGFPFIFGFSVYENFESPIVAKNGKLEMPTKSERFCGGHAVLCVGYDDETRRVIVKNSWGENWGIKGYFTMPYEYISNPELADDMWMIKK